jgi:hypothetical protein
VSVTFVASGPLAKSGVSIANLGGRRGIGAARGDIVAAASYGRNGSSVANRSGPRRSRILLAVIGILFATAAVGFALAKPGPVLRVVPRLAPAYAALGLNVNLRGFEFEHVTARFEDVGGGRFLAVEGILRNVAQKVLDAPRLRVTLSDAKGTPVYFWAASSGVKALPPGEAAPFRAKLAAPPLEAQSVTVDFMP